MEASSADSAGLPPATDDERLPPSTLFAALEGNRSFDLLVSGFCESVFARAGGGACAWRRELLEGGRVLCPPWDAVDEVELEGLRESFAREY